MPRFARPGTATLHFVPAVASLAAPTRVEITAGDELIADFREATGFTSEQERIAMPDYVSNFTPSLAGRQAAGNPTIVFYDLDQAGANAIRAALAEGTEGFLIRMPYGDVAGRRCEVWPVTVGAQNDDDWAADNESAKWTVALSVTSAPEKDAVVPAP